MLKGVIDEVPSPSGIADGYTLETLNGGFILVPLGGGGSSVWGSIIGTLSSQTDLQTALDAKVDENTAITGATKTKITYDAKGLVTAGADATTADIADSTDKRYVSDAQLVVVGNTSGTNTGDQTNITGSAAKWTTGRTLAITGDLTYTSPALDGSGNVTAAGTLATVNSNVGSFGSATQVAVLTGNAKGLITGIGNTAIQIAESQVTNLVTDLAGKQPAYGNFTNTQLLYGDGTSTPVQSAGLNWDSVNSILNATNVNTSFLSSSEIDCLLYSTGSGRKIYDGPNYYYPVSGSDRVMANSTGDLFVRRLLTFTTNTTASATDGTIRYDATAGHFYGRRGGTEFQLENQVTLTTSGTSGAATYTGGTLNIPVYQAAGTYVNSVTGTTNRITAIGGSTPVIDISSSYVGQNSITTLGTIGTGTWSATNIAVTSGGTGRATGTTAYALIATGTTATGAQQTLANGATTEILIGGGASALPVWTTAQGSGAPLRATSPTITTPTIAKLANLATNGFVKTSGSDGTLSVDTTAYASLAGATFVGAVAVPDDAYASAWNGSANVPTKNAVYDMMSGTRVVGVFQLASNASTAANTTPIVLSGMVFSYEANSTYKIEIIGAVQSAVITTGYGFNLDVSTAVTKVWLSYSSQLANTGTLTGGSSIADATTTSETSGVPTANTDVPVIAKGLLLTTTNAGTAQLQFNSEVAAVTTCIAGTTMIITKLV